MSEGNSDIFFELTNSKGDLVAGECTDQVFAGKIEITDFELSARSMADKQKAEAMQGMLEASTESGKTDVKTGDIDLRHLEERKKGEKGVFTLKLTKETDSSSPGLALSYSQNLRKSLDCFPTGKLYIRKRGGTKGGVVFLTIIFKNMYVVNYNMNLSGGKGSSGTSLAEEDLEFVFESLALKYVQQDKGGGETGPAYSSWSFKDKDADSSLEQQLKSP